MNKLNIDNEVKIAESAMELTVRYAFLVGEESIKASASDTENYFDYIIEPQEYTDALHHDKLLPPIHIVEQFLNNFYDEEEVNAIMISYRAEKSESKDAAQTIEEIQQERDVYKNAFETVTKYLKGYSEYHDNGSIILNLIMMSADNEDVDIEAFSLIDEAMNPE